ncbi:unnamed protein product, partial [Lymnaea stagnalis]
ISLFLKTFIAKDNKDVKAIPVSNNTVSNRIDEMSKDIEIQHVEKLRKKLE